ncbi:MAG: uL15 family ribosomal protein [Candidatus Nealsonbacteria bacterium]
MQLHQLKAKHKAKKSKRVGRGGKRGTFSGKGVKGQCSRAGRKFKPDIRELIKRYPKLRGYRYSISSPKRPGMILKLDVLEKNFNLDDKISPMVLLEKKIIHKIKGRMPVVKLLGGDIKKALFVEGCQVSKSAKEKIEKVGGKVN